MKSRLLSNSAGTFTVILPESQIDAFFNDNPPPTPLAKIYFGPTACATYKVTTCVHWANEKVMNEKLSELLLLLLKQTTEKRTELLNSKALNDNHYIAVKIIKQTAIVTIIMKFIDPEGSTIFSLHADIKPESLNQTIITQFIDAVINLQAETGDLRKGGEDIDDTIFKAMLATPVPAIQRKTVAYMPPQGSIWTVLHQPLKVYDGWIAPDKIASQTQYELLKAEIEKMKKIEDDLPETARTYMKKVSLLLGNVNWSTPTAPPIPAGEETVEA